MRDELLQPTVGAVNTSARPPWRLSSQLYVMFFGGALAGTTIAFVNAGRLGASPRQRAMILAAGLFALIVTIPIVLWMAGVGTPGLRVATRLPAMAAYAVQARLMRTLDRSFELRRGEYASLWGPGLAAVFGCGLPEAVLLTAVVAAGR